MPAAERLKAVLIVEDDPDILELITDVLELSGFHVVTTSDGQQAIDTLGDSATRAETLGVILLDMMLPYKDGVAVLEYLNNVGNTVPVIAMSASRQHLLAAINAGAHAAITKPFDIDEVISMVAYHCSTT